MLLLSGLLSQSNVKALPTKPLHDLLVAFDTFQSAHLAYGSKTLCNNGYCFRAMELEHAIEKIAFLHTAFYPTCSRSILNLVRTFRLIFQPFCILMRNPEISASFNNGWIWNKFKDKAVSCYSPSFGSYTRITMEEIKILLLKVILKECPTSQNGQSTRSIMPSIGKNFQNDRTLQTVHCVN